MSGVHACNVILDEYQLHQENFSLYNQSIRVASCLETFFRFSDSVIIIIVFLFAASFCLHFFVKCLQLPGSLLTRATQLWNKTVESSRNLFLILCAVSQVSKTWRKLPSNTIFISLFIRVCAGQNLKHMWKTVTWPLVIRHGRSPAPINHNESCFSFPHAVSQAHVSEFLIHNFNLGPNWIPNSFHDQGGRSELTMMIPQRASLY